MITNVAKTKKGKGRKGEGTLMSENRVAVGDILFVPRRFLRTVIADVEYCFRRTSTGADISQIAASDNTGAYSFVLSAVPGYTEFTSLFDQYRIAMVRVVWRPRFNMSAIQAVSTDVNPLMISVIDYDDASTLTITQMLNYQSYKETRFDKDHVRCIAPRIAIGAYSGTFTSFC